MWPQKETEPRVKEYTIVNSSNRGDRPDNKLIAWKNNAVGMEISVLNFFQDSISWHVFFFQI